MREWEGPFNKRQAWHGIIAVERGRTIFFVGFDADDMPVFQRPGLVRPVPEGWTGPGKVIIGGNPGTKVLNHDAPGGMYAVGLGGETFTFQPPVRYIRRSELDAMAHGVRKYFESMAQGIDEDTRCQICGNVNRVYDGQCASCRRTTVEVKYEPRGGATGSGA